MRTTITFEEITKAAKQLVDTKYKNKPLVYIGGGRGGGKLKYLLEDFMKFGYGFKYFYWPGRGYYDRNGNLYKSIKKAEEKKK